MIEAGPNSRDVEAINDSEAGNNITVAQCDWAYSASFENGTALATKIRAGRCLGEFASFQSQSRIEYAVGSRRLFEHQWNGLVSQNE